MVSALSWRGGSKRGRRATNSQGPPSLFMSPSGTSYNKVAKVGLTLEVTIIIV